MGNEQSNTTDPVANESESAGVPRQPGAQPANNSTNNSDENRTSSNAQVSVSAPDYRLRVGTQAQVSECTYSEDIEKFYAQLEVEAPYFESETRPPVDIVAVLDVSGSMQGDKISLVRKSMRRLVRSVQRGDRVAFVTFDSRVKVLMNFCEMNQTNKEKALDLITKLKAGSSTNLCGGIVEGVEQLMNNRVNEIAAVLLFTDGQANVGVRNTVGITQEVLKVSNALHSLNQKDVESWSVEDVCQWLKNNNLGAYETNFRQQNIDGSIVKHDLNEEMLTNLGIQVFHLGKFSRELAKLREDNPAEEGQNAAATSTEKQNQPEGFRLHTFGFGANHNENLLEKLANSFDGMYFFMENENAIKEGFSTCLGGLLSTVAQNIEFELQFNPELSNVKVHNNKVKEADGKYKVQYADLQSEEKREVLVSFKLPAKQVPDSEYLLFEVNYSYSNAISGAKDQGVVQCQINRNGKMEGFSETVDETKNRVVAQEALKNAMAFGDKNDLKKARSCLDAAVNELQQSRTCANEVVTDLLGDLSQARSEIRDTTAYKSKGRKYMMQNAMCFEQQRCCNEDYSQYRSQAKYRNTRQRKMKVDWDAQDECDSDEEY